MVRDSRDFQKDGITFVTKSYKVEKPQIVRPMNKDMEEEIKIEDTVFVEEPRKIEAKIINPSNLKTVDIKFYSKQKCFSKP